MYVSAVSWIMSVSIILEAEVSLKEPEEAGGKASVLKEERDDRLWLEGWLVE